MTSNLDTLEALVMEGIVFFKSIEDRVTQGDITPAFAAEALAALPLIEKLQVEPEVLQGLRDTLTKLAGRGPQTTLLDNLRATEADALGQQ